jgi:hypothetical protein
MSIDGSTTPAEGGLREMDSLQSREIRVAEVDFG